MLKIDELITPPTPSKYYLVPCVKIPLTVEGFRRGEWVPIIGSLHQDAEIGADFDHYHYDRRFCKDQIPPDAVIALISGGKHFFPKQTTEIIYHAKKCHWSKDISFRNYMPKVVDRLEQLQTGQMQNLICPHRGASLASIEQHHGCVVCPLHGLKWKIETGELVRVFG
jgi:Rieske [2Fe-2S] domain